MDFGIQRRRVGRSLGLLLLALAGVAEAHVVPSMTVEAGFSEGGEYSLKINVDPRTFLAPDPTTLPPVPASWYREQSPEQIAATHERAQAYLAEALGLLFDGEKVPLPRCRIEAINGEDNTPLSEETRELHLLATVTGPIPDAAATTFQIDYSKTANTSLILLHSKAGKTDLRPQVLFPGEISRAFQLEVHEKKPVLPVAPPTQAASPVSRLFLVLSISVSCVLVIIGWRLLGYYRHHHRAHQKPRSM
ncbi:MAG: hypothetical protein R3F13_03305 [Prosthecobacter sp.]